MNEGSASDWKAIAEQLSKETDPSRILELAAELSVALAPGDRKNIPNASFKQEHEPPAPLVS